MSRPRLANVQTVVVEDGRILEPGFLGTAAEIQALSERIAALGPGRHVLRLPAPGRLLDAGWAVQIAASWGTPHSREAREYWELAIRAHQDGDASACAAFLAEVHDCLNRAHNAQRSAKGGHARKRRDAIASVLAARLRREPTLPQDALWDSIPVSTLPAEDYLSTSDDWQVYRDSPDPLGAGGQRDRTRESLVERSPDGKVERSIKYGTYKRTYFTEARRLAGPNDLEDV